MELKMGILNSSTTAVNVFDLRIFPWTDVISCGRIYEFEPEI